MEIDLLRILLKLNLFLKEAKNYSQRVGPFIEAYLSCAGFALILMLLIDRMTDKDMRQLTTFMIYLLWAVTNVILFSCAYVYSRTIEVEKIAWSILAQLSLNYQMALESEQAGLASICIGPTDWITARWRNLVHNHSLSHSRNSIKLFNTSLTYRNALQLNFYIISLASLLQTVNLS